MAIQLGSAFGTIGLDIGGLRKAAAESRAPLAEIERNFSGMGPKAEAAASLIQTAMDRIKNTINLQARQYAILQKELDATATKYGAASLQAQRKQLALDRLDVAMRNNRERLSGLQRDLDGASAKTGLFGAALEGIATKLAMVGTALAVSLGAALAGFGAASVSTAADFEQAMARVGAVSNASAGELATLTQAAKEMGASTVFSASQAADGMQFLAMAGFSVNEITAAMPGLLDAAAASQMDLGRAADITSNVLTGFGLAAGEAGRVADVLVFASSNANTTVEQLGSAMKMVAPVAASLGISLEDTTAAIAKMSDAGIQGEMAGTALRGSLIRLSAPTKEADSLIRSLGLELFDAQGSMKALPAVIGEFETALGGMTDQQRMAALQTIVGTEAAAGFLALMGSGSQSIEAFSAALERSGGTASRIAAAQMDTLSGATKEFESALQGLQISIGDRLIPGLTALTRAGTEVVRWLDAVLPTLDAMGRTIQEYVIPAMAGLTAATLAYAVTSLPAMSIALQAALPALMATITAMGSLAVATLAAAAPFAVLAAAIAGAILIYQRWQSISQDAVAMWEAQRREMTESADALTAYTSASKATQAVLSQQAERLRALRDAQRAEMMARAEAARQGNKDAAWWEESNRRSRERLALIDQLSGQLTGYLDLAQEGSEADLRAAVAADVHAEALARLVQETGALSAATETTGQRLAALAARSARGAADSMALALAYAEGRISAEQLAASLTALERSQDAVAEAEARRAEANALAVQQAQAVAQATARQAADAQLAYGDVEGALASLRAAAGLTEERMGELGKSIETAAASGAAAYGKAVAGEAGFLTQREAAFASHQATMASLVAELGAAISAAEYDAVLERISVAEAGYAEQEQRAAEAYATQQAAQRAHLGTLLIDYAAAQAELAGIAPEAIAEMTRALADAYGVQQSIADRSFGQMTQSIDAWVAAGGKSTDLHLSDLSRITDATVALQRETDRIRAEMIAQARTDFAAGGMDATTYADKLTAIEGEARRAAEALLGIPTRIDSQVVVTTTRVESAGSGGRMIPDAGIDPVAAPPRPPSPPPRTGGTPPRTNPPPRPPRPPITTGGSGGGRTTTRATGPSPEQREAEQRLKELQATLDRARAAGATAFAVASSTETAFIREREAALSKHQSTMAELTKALATATTDAEREAVQQRIAVTEAGYQEQERQAAEAYAKQQADQRAHLGRMLIDYAVAQGQMAGIATDKLDAMTRQLADVYGVQQSLADRSFTAMTRSIDAWVQAGGEGADQHLADLGRITDETIALQRETDRVRREMIEQAQRDFARGALNADQYADALSQIERRAREAAEANLGIAPSALGAGLPAPAALALPAATGASAGAVTQQLVASMPEFPTGLFTAMAGTLDSMLDALVSRGPQQVNVSMPITVTATGVDSDARVEQLTSRLQAEIRRTIEGLFDGTAETLVREQR